MLLTRYDSFLQAVSCFAFLHVAPVLFEELTKKKNQSKFFFFTEVIQFNNSQQLTGIEVEFVIFLKNLRETMTLSGITIVHRTAVVPKARPTRSMFGLEGSGLVAVKAFLLTTEEKQQSSN